MPQQRVTVTKPRKDEQRCENKNTKLNPLRGPAPHGKDANSFKRRISREKGRDLTQPYDKSPHTNRNVKRVKRQHKQRHKKIDYTAVAGPT